MGGGDGEGYRIYLFFLFQDDATHPKNRQKNVWRRDKEEQTNRCSKQD